MRERSVAGICAALLLLPGVWACADRGGEDDAGGAEPRQGGTLVIAAPSDLENVNSLVTGDQFTMEVARHMLFLPLVDYTETLDYEPVLATEWELLADTGVVFHLRRDVRWHDGRPTTAADVAFTYERAKDPATAYPKLQ
jgi:peptide/nickel transport system substrate-binding protein